MEGGGCGCCCGWDAQESACGCSFLGPMQINMSLVSQKRVWRFKQRFDGVRLFTGFDGRHVFCDD